MANSIPALNISDWKATRDTLHQYAKIIGKVRSNYMPRSKHWWHITLYVTATGLTTTAFPVGGQSIELVLDLSSHQLIIQSSQGWSNHLTLINQSTASISQNIIRTLAANGVAIDKDILSAFDDTTLLDYDVAMVNNFRIAINWIDIIFKQFKSGLREESGPVQIFPHHMDISMNWFSGRRLPDVDPKDEENADEQMNFGFVTGDEGIENAYFYATSYPNPESWGELTLPQGAYWHTEGWVGAILPYAELAKSSQPDELLSEFLVKVQAHGASLMK